MNENGPHAVLAAVVVMVVRSVLGGAVRAATRLRRRVVPRPPRGGSTVSRTTTEQDASPRDATSSGAARPVTQHARASGRSRVQQAGGDITAGA